MFFFLFPIVESRATLLSRDLKRNLFNLFASWGGPLTKQLVNVYHAANCVEEAKLQFGALWVCCYVFIYTRNRDLCRFVVCTNLFICVRLIELIQTLWSLQIHKGNPRIQFYFSLFYTYFHQAMSALLCCGPCFDSQYLCEDGILYPWLDMLLTSPHDNVSTFYL